MNKDKTHLELSVADVPLIEELSEHGLDRNAGAGHPWTSWTK